MNFLPNAQLRKANNAPSQCEQVSIALGVLFWIVPVSTIDLYSDAMRQNSEVNEVSSYAMLREKIDVFAFESQSHNTLYRGFVAFLSKKKIWVFLWMFFVELSQSLAVLRVFCPFGPLGECFGALFDGRACLFGLSFKGLASSIQRLQLSWRRGVRFEGAHFCHMGKVSGCHWAFSGPVIVTRKPFGVFLAGYARCFNSSPNTFIGFFGQSLTPLFAVLWLAYISASLTAVLGVIPSFLGGANTSREDFKGGTTNSACQFDGHFITSRRDSRFSFGQECRETFRSEWFMTPLLAHAYCNILCQWAKNGNHNVGVA